MIYIYIGIGIVFIAALILILLKDEKDEIDSILVKIDESEDNIDILHEKNIEVRQIIGTKNYWLQVIFWTIIVQMIACFGRVPSAGGFMYANF